MAVKRKYRLNLRNYGNLPAIMLSQYDEGYALEFEIRDGTDAASDLSAYTVTLKGTRADTLAYSFAGTVSTNVLTFVIDTTMTACAGRGTAEIAIKDTANDVLFATFNMPVFVERAAVPEGSIDADVERAQEIAEQVQEIVDNAAAAVSGEAEKWATGQIDGTDVPSTDPAYENNAKYYAEQAADAAASIGIDATLTQAGKAADAKKTGDEIGSLKEDFTAVDTEVTDIRVGADGTTYNSAGAAVRGQISALNSELVNVINGADEHYEDVILTSGYYIKSGNVYTVDLTPIAYASSQYAVIDCKAGDKFVLNSINSANYDRAWCFIDAENDVILPIASIGTISETIVAPDNAVKVIFNDSYPSTGTIKKYVPEIVGLNVIAEKVEENTADILWLEKDRNSFNVDQIGFKLVENAYVNGDTGAFVTYSSSPTWSRTDYIAVDNTVSLIINTTRQGGDNAFYDANKNYISKIQLYVGENKIVVPTNAKYAAFSSRSADMENLTIQREYLDQAIREKNVVYNANAIFGITDFGTIYNVGDGKTYETINSAITAWENAGYPYATIFIDPGEYKEAVTIESGHQINLIGSGIDSTIIHTTSGNYVDAPITIFHGTVTVKNMTLLADHSENPNFDYEAPQTLKAYGIHIDHGSVGGVVSVEKCKIISYQAPAVGTGTIPDSKIRLVDCECYSFTDFTSDTTTHQYYQLHNGAILWHTSNAEYYPNRGNESFEMVNVKAYNKNDYCVLRLIKNQDEDAMSLLAINTTLVKGTETWQSPILGTVTIAEGSAFNNYDKLNYN